MFDTNKQQGGVARQKLAGNTTYITFQADAGNALGAVLAATAPAEQVRIDEGVDFALNKSLAGDFLVSTFGYRPVVIVISGLDIYNDPCLMNEGKGQETVQSFFDKWNVHANKKARIDVGLASAGGAGIAYRCVLVDLKRISAQELTGGGVGRYTMTLYGAKVTK